MIVTCPRNLNEAKNLSPYSDFFLVGVLNYTGVHNHPFFIPELWELKKIKANIILRLDNMVFEKDILGLEELINECKDDFYYYVSDLGLVELLAENNLIHKTIYDPKTMITNHLDAKYYYDLGLAGVGISNEITLNDAKVSADLNSFYQVFGYRLMYVSKRKAVKLYLERKNVPYSNQNLKIVEVSRNEAYPIFEDNNGDYIYRDYVINLMKEFKETSFKYNLLESLLIPETKYLEVCQLYYRLAHNEITTEEALTIFNQLELVAKDGFSYQDSVYQKEEF